jgi:hypothetical protein
MYCCSQHVHPPGTATWKWAVGLATGKAASSGVAGGQTAAWRSAATLPQATMAVSSHTGLSCHRRLEAKSPRSISPCPINKIHLLFWGCGSASAP